MSHPFNRPKPGMGQYQQTDHPSHAPYGCLLNSATGAPFLDLGEIGYLSSTSLRAAIASAGWPLPEEFAPLERAVAEKDARIAELERELEKNRLDARQIEAAKALHEIAVQQKAALDLLRESAVA